MTTTTAIRLGAVKTITAIVTAPYEYTDRSLATASWFDKYTILPGEYPVRLTNIGGTDWNPDPDVPTPGYIGNIGPEYGVIDLKARLIESYRESRLLHEIRGSLSTHDKPATVHLRVYGYELKHGATFHNQNITIEITEE